MYRRAWVQKSEKVWTFVNVRHGGTLKEQSSYKSSSEVGVSGGEVKGSAPSRVFRSNRIAFRDSLGEVEIIAEPLGSFCSASTGLWEPTGRVAESWSLYRVEELMCVKSAGA
ncbi:hypothetical protein TNCV_4820581 [Trichonephila clavipes]|nr:hypothetical protein TNCV_4820581 [Trichonephila clavipes]